MAVWNGAVIAPAGHGKTEMIAEAAAQGQRTLILTHTHAGIQAIRARLKRMRVSHTQAAVDTISGWCVRYVHAFPGVGKPPIGIPSSAQEWDQIYAGAARALAVPAIADVVASSYDRVLIDEYQDCTHVQHSVTRALVRITPTVVFGDPMQGIFEFTGATLNWQNDIHPHFPLLGSLDVPYRWNSSNPALGEWIAQTRERLLRAERIDLDEAPVEFRETDDAFDMSVFFDHHDHKTGTMAAVYCRKQECYQLASATSGRYQAIEENAANRLGAFAATWDRASDTKARTDAFAALFKDCVRIKKLDENDPAQLEHSAVYAAMRESAARLGDADGIAALSSLLALSRRSPKWKVYRGELWRDTENAVAAVAAGRAETMEQAVNQVRRRASLVGRRLPARTISTPLLLKGLEFDHVVIPNVQHFLQEQRAQAKLFYSAISRARKSLTIAASNRYIQFPAPQL